MSTEFNDKQKAQFMAFLAGETDDFDLWACDPETYAVACSQIADGLSVESCGGMLPFQAQGAITALAADGSNVPMRWYYRSKHGVARLNVAVTQCDCPGLNPLYTASLEEFGDEFDYSDWLRNLRLLIATLKPVVEFSDEWPIALRPEVELAPNPFRVIER